VNISKYKKFYKSIGAVRCPYFGNELVVFNKKGFDHILRKDNMLRPWTEISERLSLLIYCQEILAGNHGNVEYETRGGRVRAQFWGFRAKIKGIKMKVIVRQLGLGYKHFFGVVPLKTLNTPRP
jgi:hypothetical protein